MPSPHGTERSDIPGPALLLRDFINTAEPQTGGERLRTPAQLEKWTRGHGLGPASGGRTFTASDVTVVVALREGMRAVLHSHAGHAPPAGARSTLDDALAQVPLRASFDAAGGLRLGPAADGALASLVAGLLDTVRQAAEDGSWDRLKVCAKDSCRWAFYDTSRNRSGRWCSMAGCGNQVKMRRAHARRRATAA